MTGEREAGVALDVTTRRPAGDLRGSVRRLFTLLGKRVIVLLSLGLLVGLLLFVVEFAFANSFQFLLVSLGVMPKSSLPGWAPQLSLLAVLAIVLLIGSAKALLQWAQTYLQSVSFEEARYLQRSRVVRWAIFSSGPNSGHVVTLYNDRISAFSSIIMTVQTLAVTLTALLFIGISLFALTPWATAVAVGVLAAIGVMLRSLDHRISHAAKRWLKAGESANRRLLMSMKNLLLLQIYGTQAVENERAQKNLREFRDEIATFHEIIGVKATVAQLAGLALVCGTAFFIVRSRALPNASVIAFFYLFMRFVQYLAECAKTIGVYSLNWPQYKEYVSWWTHQGSSVSTRATQRDVSVSDVERRMFAAPVGWKLSRVAYRYPEASRDVIGALDLEIQPGSLVAIIGSSGVGKSTLLNLIIGNLDPSEGSIRLYNEAGAVELSAARRHLLPTLGYVGPESFLIEGTVLENIHYGLDTEPTQAEIDRAIRMAECSFIYEMPNGLGQRLTEQGQGLSAGQKQRLCLARALLRKPTALILDEATSNLDRETELRLLETLNQLKGAVTIIAVSHRKEILEYADQVLELRAA